MEGHRHTASSNGECGASPETHHPMLPFPKLTLHDSKFGMPRRTWAQGLARRHRAGFSATAQQLDEILRVVESEVSSGRSPR